MDSFYRLRVTPQRVPLNQKLALDYSTAQAPRPLSVTNNHKKDLGSVKLSETYRSNHRTSSTSYDLPGNPYSVTPQYFLYIEFPSSPPPQSVPFV